MAKPNGRGGWDLTDADVAEIMAVNWPDSEWPAEEPTPGFTSGDEPCPVCEGYGGSHDLARHLGAARMRPEPT